MTYNNLYQCRWNVILFLFIEVLKPVNIGEQSFIIDQNLESNLERLPQNG